MILSQQSAVLDFVQHDSWRCEHAPHYYLADGKGEEMYERGECPCGLLKALREDGIDPAPWMPAADGEAPGLNLP